MNENEVILHKDICREEIDIVKHFAVDKLRRIEPHRVDAAIVARAIPTRSCAFKVTVIKMKSKAKLVRKKNVPLAKNLQLSL